MSRTAPDGGATGALADVGSGIARGSVVFAAVGALALGIGLSEFAASGGAYHWWTWVKVGGLYLVSFFGTSARVDLGGKTLFVLRLPLLTGTVLAGWMLLRAGRWVVSARAGAWRRAGSVVLGFAGLVTVVGVLARLRFPGLGGPGVDATLGAVTWEVLAFPVLFAAGAVAVGAWWASPRTPGLHAMIAGGWRMWWLALALSFAGLLLVASIRSDRTANYAGWLGSQGTGGALLFGHQVLSAPNQALFLLAPAMGGSTSVRPVSGGGGTLTTLSLDGVGRFAFPVPGAPNGFPPRTLGGLFFLFLLAPAAATVAGGWFAARGSSSTVSGLARGAGSGVVFGGLVTLASACAYLQAPLSRAGSPLRIGPAMPSTAALAFVWGLGGGALGGLLGSLRSRYTPGEGVLDGADPPLSPTSA